MSTDNRIRAAVQSAASPMEAAGAAFMLHPEQHEASLAAGYDHPFSGYFAGRGGMVGDVSAEQLTETFYSFPLEVVSLFWNAGKPVHGAAGGADLYHSQAATWAEKQLAGVEGLERYAELGEKIIAKAPADAGPVYAGWAARPRATSPAAHAFQVLLVLRELRGALHIAGLRAAGIGPKEAHLLNNPGYCPNRPPSGEAYAGLFGWSEPWPDVSHLKAGRDEVEEATNTQVTEIVASALTAEEAEEFAGIAAAIEAAACPPA